MSGGLHYMREMHRLMNKRTRGRTMSRGRTGRTGTTANRGNTPSPPPYRSPRARTPQSWLSFCTGGLCGRRKTRRGGNRK